MFVSRRILAATGVAATSAYWGFRSPAECSPAFDAKDFQKFKISKIEKYNHNTKKYTVQSPGQEPLPVTSFVLFRTIGKDGKEVVRPYTPIGQPHNGEVDFLIKTYPDGVLSKHLDGLNVGAEIEIKGPLGKLPYKPNFKKEIGMLAGGTGITPMLQVIEAILSNPADKTKITLVFGNISEVDILLKETLDALAAKHSNFKVVYTLDKPKDDWKGLKGHVNAEVIKKYLPAPADDILILVCGPDGFYKALSGNKAPDYSQGELTGLLKELGYTKDQVFKF